MTRKPVITTLTRLDAMLRHRGLRAASGLLVALLLVTSLFSIFWFIGYRDPGLRYDWFFSQGSFHVRTYSPNWWRGNICFSQCMDPGFNMYEGWRSRVSPFYTLLPLITREPGRRYVGIPLHLPMVVLSAVALYPMLPFVRRRWRRKRNLCVVCGYNLTGLTEPRCPECGTEFRFS